MKNQGLRFSGMESIFSGFVLDPAKCSELSLEEKRELVYEISQWSKNAPEILQSWSRRELLEVICAEMGKERKYTGVTKIKMIEHLLRLVLEKKSGKKTNHSPHSPLSPSKTQGSYKKQKKKEDPLRSFNEVDHFPSKSEGEEHNDILLCRNLACRASLSEEDAFCKRCSCCICYRYDDNKDPSLWLVCGSDLPKDEGLCGMSCHLKCALKHEKAGITKNGRYTKLDGGFYCVSCGKVNGLMGSWRKQMLIAKDARRVDVLCCRISLSHKILRGTERYKELQRIVNIAVKKLRKEVGPLEHVSAKMARGIVNRLHCSTEVQKLCAFAVEAVDNMLSGLSGPLQPLFNVDSKDLITSSTPPLACHVVFEDISPTSIAIVLEYEDKLVEEIIGCRLWHRKSAFADYSKEPTCIVTRLETRFVISGLDPSTEYFFKVSPFSSKRQVGEWEARWVTRMPCGPQSHQASDPVSALDEGHGMVYRALVLETDSQRDSTNSSDDNQVSKIPTSFRGDHSKVRSLEEISNECHLPPPMDGPPFVQSSSNPPSMPCKSEGPTEVPDSSNKKQSMEREYEYCVKVIRWLECEGHMEKEFRVKFLTWFSLRATMQERRVVSAFIDTLIDDPPSLVGQLADAFMDGICGKEKKQVLRNGFCTRLWH
ncbi:VIN3-like protein 2 [Magnolia sinica]|uniref:VIN3-like protein 2 n=1 Tax=Magnolia sinica TaxID=86752 RepID=UPI0026596FDE|nr:VIN3-like protein 2 [Magnolia sinica]